MAIAKFLAFHVNAKRVYNGACSKEHFSASTISNRGPVI